MSTRWSERFATRTARMSSSAIREILKVTQQPDVISFAGGLPAPELFPIAAMEAACQRVLAAQGPAALQYSTTEGYLPLRHFLAGQLAAVGIAATAPQLLITHGSQQGLDLIGKVLLNPGDPVLVEAPTYLGAIQAWRPYEPRFITVPVDDQGMQIDLLPPILARERPKFIYALPNFQNPTGVSLSLERRKRLVALAQEYHVPIVEDDPYGALRYSESPLASLHQLSAAAGGPDESEVLYLGTFSKTLSPGLRIGWLLAPQTVFTRLVQAKQGADLHTNTLGQMIAYEVVKDGFLVDHVARLQEVYCARRDTMLGAMVRHFPPGVTWTHPAGGLFLWVTLPAGMDAGLLLAEAVAAKVAFVPGGAFFANGGGDNTLRLNFSNANAAQIEAGIQRLGEVIDHSLPLAAARIAQSAR